MYMGTLFNIYFELITVHRGEGSRGFQLKVWIICSPPFLAKSSHNNINSYTAYSPLVTEIFNLGQQQYWTK